MPSSMLRTGAESSGPSRVANGAVGMSLETQTLVSASEEKNAPEMVLVALVEAKVSRVQEDE